MSELENKNSLKMNKIVTKIEDIENAIKSKNVTFSKFVIQACEYALNNIEDTKNQ